MRSTAKEKVNKTRFNPSLVNEVMPKTTTKTTNNKQTDKSFNR